MALTRYLNLNGNAGVEFYDFGPDWIEVKFYKNPRVYRYTNAVTGASEVAAMRKMAVAGRGLSKFIQRNQKTLKFI